MFRKIAVLAGWKLIKQNNNYYIPYVHFCYLEYMSKRFEEIYLIVPVKKNMKDIEKLMKIEFKNIKIIELPYYSNYINSIFLFKKFYTAIKKLNHISYFYVRVPDPYCWMPKLIFGKKTIMHFVGDSIEVIKQNKKLSNFKKILLIIFYLPEYFLTLLAAKFSETYTNGYHLSNKLKKFFINTTPVISSIVTENDFYKKIYKNNDQIKLLYIGYLRASKGIDTLIYVLYHLVYKKNMQNVKLSLVGDGEFFNDILLLINKLNLNKYIKFYGFVNDRKILNNIMRSHDIFLFPSLSEGSPRVVLEAMANSLPVISTPVGSLPEIFKHKEEILFSKFNDVNSFTDNIEFILNNPILTNKMIEKAFFKVKNNYTRDKFLDKIFKELL